MKYVIVRNMLVFFKQLQGAVRISFGQGIFVVVFGKIVADGGIFPEQIFNFWFRGCLGYRVQEGYRIRMPCPDKTVDMGRNFIGYLFNLTISINVSVILGNLTRRSQTGKKKKTTVLIPVEPEKNVFKNLACIVMIFPHYSSGIGEKSPGIIRVIF